MEKSPAFQWYPKDFLTDENVDVMSLEQRGAYITLLSKCWIEGSLPMEQTKLKAMCNHPSNWDSIWEGLTPCFVENGQGRLINSRLEKERKKQKEWRTKSRRGGIISGKVRREKASKGGSSMVQTKKEPKGNSSSSVFSLQSSTSSSKEKRKEKSSTANAVQGIVNLYNKHCPSLPKVQRISQTRKQKVRARLREFPEDEPWVELFKRVEASDFLTGRNGEWTSCGFDWLLKEANIIKVLEGNYDNKGRTAQVSFSDLTPELEKIHPGRGGK